MNGYFECKWVVGDKLYLAVQAEGQTHSWSCPRATALEVVLWWKKRLFIEESRRVDPIQRDVDPIPALIGVIVGKGTAIASVVRGLSVATIRREPQQCTYGMLVQSQKGYFFRWNVLALDEKRGILVHLSFSCSTQTNRGNDLAIYNLEQFTGESVGGRKTLVASPRLPKWVPPPQNQLPYTSHKQPHHPSDNSALIKLL